VNRFFLLLLALSLAACGFHLRGAAAQEYELKYTLGYRLDSPDGKPRLDARNLTVFRQYRFDPDAVLAKGEEERRLQEEMRRAAVGRLLRQLTLRLSNPEPAGAPAS